MIWSSVLLHHLRRVLYPHYFANVFSTLPFIAEINEDRMLNEGSLLMDRMFEEDPVMERFMITFMITRRDSLTVLQCQVDLGMS